MITYNLTKFGTDWLIFVNARVQTKSDSAIFPNQGQITADILVQFDPLWNSSETLWAYILWPSLVLLVNICRCKSVNKVKCGQFSNSRADNLDSSGPIRSIIKLIRKLMITYNSRKFGADWLIFVDARMLTRKRGRTRQMVSDHNSVMSTLC